MSKQTGYTCDGCKRFEPSGSKFPPGWTSAVIHAVRYKPEPAFATAVSDDEETASKTDTFDFCSNRCHALWAVERAKADGTWEEKPRRVGRPRKTGDDVARSTHLKYHGQGRHDGAPVDACPKCQEAKAP